MFVTVTMTEWDENGHLLVQHDAHGDGGKPGAMNVHQYGFLSRPHDPGADGIGCIADERGDGSERFSWLADDTRSTDWLPRVTKGGSAQYGGPLGKGLAWREIDGDTGSIVDYVPTAWDGSGVPTAAHKLEIGVDGNGAAVVQLIHSEGMALVMVDGETTIADATGSGLISVKGGVVTISGSTKLVGGLDVGGTGGIPLTLQPPLAAALTALCSAIQGAVPVAGDGGAAVLVALKAGATALLAAMPATAATMAKSI